MMTNWNQDLDFDRDHIWHPYTSMNDPLHCYGVESAQGVRIKLQSGEQLIDGMSSWWAAIHGYNHPRLNSAISEQMKQVSHVMFGGLTHQPAIKLCRKLIELTPQPLEKVFLSDSGSVAVEVAIKMAIQYWAGKKQPQKKRLLTIAGGYHGDTMGAMSVCDPDTGMHHLFQSALTQQIFAPLPQPGFYEQWDPDAIKELERLFQEHHQSLAAFILEPVVQGAGGMRIYHPEYLKQCRSLCDRYQVLFIVDEIATGFGRTGKLFASEHAGICADILCLGKALTGGMMTLAATCCTEEVARGISDSESACFMHGPTFMANPLACAVANASIELLLENTWQQQIMAIEQQFFSSLMPLKNHPRVRDVRILGAIGVVECQQRVNMVEIQKRFVQLGVWIRPFGKLIYLMPPFIIKKDELARLTQAISVVLDEDQCFLL